MYRTLDWKGKKVTVGRYGQLQFLGVRILVMIKSWIGDLPTHRFLGIIFMQRLMEVCRRLNWSCSKDNILRG